MSAYPDGGQTVYGMHGRPDATCDGEVCVVYEYKTTSTTAGTNFAATPTKWDDRDEVKWYSIALSAPKKKEPALVVYAAEAPPWEREWVERERVSPQRNVRDDRPAVWACRPRHGLSGG